MKTILSSCLTKRCPIILSTYFVQESSIKKMSLHTELVEPLVSGQTFHGKYRVHNLKWIIILGFETD